MFGTTDGQIIVMSATGAMVTQITVLEGMEITSLLWSCEKFNMEESEANQENGNKDNGEPESGMDESTQKSWKTAFVNKPRFGLHIDLFFGLHL